MKRFFLLPLIIFSVFGICGVYAQNVCRDLSDNLVRLHIVANSNSSADQEIKLKVRDEILKSSSFPPDTEKINKIACDTALSLGAGYDAKTCISRRYVPEKTYKNIRLPEGIYNCINVVLGEGEGENWWCVAYPPLCFTEAVVGELSDGGRFLLENKLDAESFRTVLYNGDVNIRFKIVDDFLKLKNALNR